MIRTRLATLEDIEKLALLFDAYRQFYEQPSDLDRARKFIRDRIENTESDILLAINAYGEVLGFCQLYPTFCSVEAEPIYALYDLFVQPVARRSGAGKALLLAAEALAVKNGKVRMDLTTARTNLPAQAAYEQLGWVRDDVFYGYSKTIRA
jgi:ribosomal protein S18 acetylase RimI-like enzyme